MIPERALKMLRTGKGIRGREGQRKGPGEGRQSLTRLGGEVPWGLEQAGGGQGSC